MPNTMGAATKIINHVLPVKKVMPLVSKDSTFENAVVIASIPNHPPSPMETVAHKLKRQMGDICHHKEAETDQQKGKKVS